MSMTRWSDSLLIAGLMACLMTTMSIAQDTSSGIIWLPEIQLSGDDYNANLPHIAVTGNDTIHAIWNGGTWRQPYRRSTDGGRTWGDVRELVTDYVEYPYWLPYSQIATDKQRVVIFAADGVNDGNRMVFLKSENSGTTWSDPMRIGTDTASGLFSCDIQGDTFVVLYQSSHMEGGGQHRSLASTDAGNTWYNLPDTLNSYPYCAMTSGAIHFVQSVHVNDAGEIQYSRSADGGISYDVLDTLTEPDGVLTPERTMTTDRQEDGSTVIVIWRDFSQCVNPLGCLIMARESQDNGKTWLPAEVYTDIPNGFVPAIATRAGTRAAVWTQATTFFDLDIACRIKNADGIFKTISVIGRGQEPVVAMTSRAVHVIWLNLYSPDPYNYRASYRLGILAQYASQISYEPGWNLVSACRSSSVAPVLPSLYSFENTYRRAQSMEFGIGYWAKVDSTVVYEGNFVDQDTIDVQQGWNLVGSITSPVDRSSIKSIPPGIIISSLFGYGAGGYHEAVTIEPGRAYWVKVAQAGQLVLRGSN